MIHEADILKAKILVVDDQEANVLLLEQTLQAAGYTAVTTTMAPDKVCELHILNRYDLILLDLLMPRMDGFAVLENLKTIETGGYVPVIVVTAQSDHKLRALKAGAKDFISKPFDLAEVLIRVHNMLEVRLLHQEIHHLYERVLLEKRISERLLLKLLPHAPVAGAPGPALDGAPGLVPGCSAEVAALFLDIAEFTTFAEGSDGEVLAVVLKELAGGEGESPAARGETRSRILENAYLAAVDLPDTLANHTLATSRKAIDLIEAVDRFNTHGPCALSVHLVIGADQAGRKAGTHGGRAH